VKIAVIDDFQDAAHNLADWGSLPAEVTFFHDHLADDALLIERLAPFDAVCIMRERTPFPASVLGALPQLKLLVTSGMRNLSVDMACAAQRGICVCGTSARGGATPELVWALIFALVRNIPTEDRALRAGRWQTTIGMQLSGKTLGLVGLGRVGSAVARVGIALEMNVLAWSPNLTPARAAEHGAECAPSLDDLLRVADVVSLHAVLTPQSRGLIGARELALMKPTAYLVNAARGPLIEEDALIEALRNRAIAGAALDVFDVEPLPANHPLLSLDNTVLAPHLGYVSTESFRDFYEQMVEDIAAWTSGKPIRVIK
jgi:phosphoglycerate dehydrogenase-like enzyme